MPPVVIQAYRMDALPPCQAPLTARLRLSVVFCPIISLMDANNPALCACKAAILLAAYPLAASGRTDAYGRFWSGKALDAHTALWGRASFQPSPKGSSFLFSQYFGENKNTVHFI